MRAGPASRPAAPSHGRCRSRSISTTRSRGRRRSPGAPAISAYWEFPTSPSINGSWRTTSRRRSRRSSRGRALPIAIAMFTVGNWSGMGLHLRGNTEAFMRAASKHKKLRIHAGTHVHPFYTEDGRRDQLRFFDYWLKGIDNGIMDEPPVKLAIRKGRDEIEWRYEQEWPLARTRWTKLY